jgi:D-alanyl-D-alanine carboxypeptidase
VFAKTGWISGVSALSGYLVPEHGRPSVFSILIEYPSELGGLNTGAWKPLQDELVLLFLGGGA